MADVQHVAPDITLDEGGDALQRNADQHDRLVMRHQPRAGDLAVHRQPHQDLDRLAGIASRVDPVGVDEGVARQSIAGEDFGHRRAALDWAVMIGSRHKLGGRNLADEFGQPAIGGVAWRARCRQAKQQQHGEQMC